MRVSKEVRIVEIDVITNLIGAIGFPIAAFIMLYWMMNTTLKDIQKVMSDNTLAITKLIEKMDAQEGGSNG